MIPSTNTKLLVAEDWKKIYQSFRNADFKSYDFETLRRTMIQYLQENYPEDFNDFIESSEYLALIDLIAYLGQNLSFRIDLNARENFLETAERRDSILRLAQLISYVPKRNTPASGFLKITAVSTTDSVLDSNRINLANSVITWNDPTNSNWYQQFISVLNAAMPSPFVYGKPYDRNTINGILTEQYRINSSNTDVPVFSFLKNVSGTNMNFEITSASFSGSTSIYEEPPAPGNSFSFLYRDDNQGFGSSNSGFFVHFRQGSLGLASFAIDAPVPNEIVGVNTANINDTDVWLWQLDGNGNYSTLWTKVPAVTGNNIIYNSLNKQERNIYSVTSRSDDQIDLNFADGSFGNLPKGQFRLLYRQSNGLTYSIKPEQMSGVQVNIPYVNKTGQSHILTLTLSLQYTVNNSSGPESDTSIKSKAPQAYYTQNRMITAEDYNIAPLTLSNDILKVKSINRISSGLSKYFDLSDVSGKYGQTNIFASDGIVYKNTTEEKFDFESTNNNEILAAVRDQLMPVVRSTAFRSFYLDNYERFSLVDLNVEWVRVTDISGQSTGYFQTIQTQSQQSTPVSVGEFTTSNLRYLVAGALIKFSDGAGNFIWTKVLKVVSDGSNSGRGALDNGTGPIVLSKSIPSGYDPIEIIPKFVTSFTSSYEAEIVSLCADRRNFGLYFGRSSREWGIILDTNLDLVSDFSFVNQGDTTNAEKDSSWLVAFTWTGRGYTVRYRITDYIFESEKQTSFFIDTDTVNYDYQTNTVIKDQISVLSFNTKNQPGDAQGLGKDYIWQVDSAIVEPDGYIDPKRVKISFYDYNSSGEIEDPDTFSSIVGTGTSYVFFFDDGVNKVPVTGIEIYQPGDTIVDGQLYYDTTDEVVKEGVNSTLVYRSEYSAYEGRPGLKFHYLHNSSNNRRIDPSKTNLVDVYLLTSNYDTEYRQWLSSGTGSEPLAPTSQSLEQNYASGLTAIKAISDEVVFHPVKYKVLFGSSANKNLQAVFKAVRNSAIPVSDNEIKSGVIEAVNDFFSLENWDFGQTFYFSELSTYVMNRLSPIITNFVIVPKNTSFGNLLEIACQSNEIFISGASVADVQVIDAITLTQLSQSSSQ